MNTTVQEAVALASDISHGIPERTGGRVVVCPPFVSIASVQYALKDSDILVGAQDAFYEASGAYTGEVAAAMLVDICQYVIIGHSERRTIFGESDATVNLKVRSVRDKGLAPILCIGESLEQREGGDAESIVESQLRKGLDGVEIGEGIVVAYEPVWAIGTGESASPEIAQSMMGHIRGTLAAMGSAEAAGDVPLLYGGSVNAGNIGGYISQPDINGALVGGASLDAGSFLEIVKVAAGN